MVPCEQFMQIQPRCLLILHVRQDFSSTHRHACLLCGQAFASFCRCSHAGSAGRACTADALFCSFQCLSSCRFRHRIGCRRLLTCFRTPLSSSLRGDSSLAGSSPFETPCICASAYFPMAAPYAWNCCASFCHPLPCSALTCRREGVHHQSSQAAMLCFQEGCADGCEPSSLEHATHSGAESCVLCIVVTWQRWCLGSRCCFSGVSLRLAWKPRA